VTTQEEKPLFIPLKSQFFDAFESGEKSVEYRLYGARWNERTCRVGRNVVLSRGYGKARRLRGTVVGFWVMKNTAVFGWRECYGDKGPAACIQIQPSREISPPPSNSQGE
jgi:hypothetical protein